MADPLRTDVATPPDDKEEALDRESRIEALLLRGLDHYFAGAYDEAVNVWTRVLFFDRSHAKARAYIERARSATAERQRQSEALIHQGAAAFDRGDGEAARQMLTTALEQAGAHDVALALLDRLNRLGTPETTETTRNVAPRVQVRGPGLKRGSDSGAAGRPRPVRVWPLVLLSGALAAGVFAAASWQEGHRLFMNLEVPLGRVPQTPASLSVPDPVPVPRRAELSLERARTLFGSGHLRDSLTALEVIPPGDPLYPEAERLKADIQRTLLESYDRGRFDGFPPADTAPAAAEAGRPAPLRE
jgi:hypothetical protein